MTDNRCQHCRRWGSDCAIAFCMGCGTPVCHGYGSARGQCPVCLLGRLPGWHFTNKSCGYKGCTEEAIYYSVPRIKRCCKTHAKRAKVRGETLADYVTRMIKERRLRYIRVDSDMYRRIVGEGWIIEPETKSCLP